LLSDATWDAIQQWVDNRFEGAYSDLADDEYDLIPALRQLDIPTLIVHGDRDVSNLEKTSRRTQQLIPNSKLIVYENAGHGLPFTHLDRLIADIIAFAA